jgi:hypothetical protein
VGFVEAATVEWLVSRGVERATLRRMLVEVLFSCVQIAAAPDNP